MCSGVSASGELGLLPHRKLESECTERAALSFKHNILKS